jgi:lysophospholipase L1-like esterase
MSTKALTLVALCGALLPSPPVAAQAGGGGPPLRLILVGDSTLAPRNGYGDALCARLTAAVHCINVAKNGRSSGSYRAEGSWAAVTALLSDRTAAATTYVLVEFGHNDQPGKPGRSTDLQREFPVNLAGYVQDIRAAGATPLLATPLSRRSFKNGVLQDDLGPWAAATRAVATEQQVMLIDLYASSTAAVQAMGSAEADTLAVEPPPAPSSAASSAAAPPGDRASIENTSPARSAFDRTHVGPKGAALFARMVEGLLRDSVPALGPYFKP